ncbi:hypothetical protein BIV25_10920 [Streptomyces sp. MUSC 14]|nr:hypothetical protein BIV25_10920 [Streptomyces sp. MUSC 14]
MAGMTRFATASRSSHRLLRTGHLRFPHSAHSPQGRRCARPRPRLPRHSPVVGAIDPDHRPDHEAVSRS